VDRRTDFVPRLAFAGLLSALLLGCASPAPDAGAEISSQAERAVGRFDAAWAPKQKPLSESRDAQQEIRRELFALAPAAAADPEEFCSDGMRTPDELSLFAQINAMYDELMSGMLDELGAHEQWNRRFAQAKSAGEGDAAKRPLYRQLVWSRARLDMMRTLLTTFKIDAEVQALRMQNACLARIILRAGPAQNAMLTGLRTRLERETGSALPVFVSPYRDAFARIGSERGDP
jgi:hypothetical protein